MAKIVSKPHRFTTRGGIISMSGIMFDKISARVIRCEGVQAVRKGEYEGIMNDLSAPLSALSRTISTSRGSSSSATPDTRRQHDPVQLPDHPR